MRTRFQISFSRKIYRTHRYNNLDHRYVYPEETNHDDLYDSRYNRRSTQRISQTIKPFRNQIIKELLNDGATID